MLMTEPREHDGYFGVFTRDQSPLAKYSNGARIVKVRTEPRDGNPLGATGTVLGSIGHPEVGVGYFVEWDRMPRCAVFVADWKLGLAS
jgi:hypothetical protein